MWSHRRVPVTNRAAAFWIDWRQHMQVVGDAFLLREVDGFRKRDFFTYKPLEHSFPPVPRVASLVAHNVPSVISTAV